jgi:hypothetical protein
MSGRGGRVDNRITKAAAFKLRCESASIPEAMRASKFTLAESSNPAKQMAVRRAYEKLIRGKTKAAPASVSLSATSRSSLSPMTESPQTESTAKTVGTQTPEREIQPMPKAKQRYDTQRQGCSNGDLTNLIRPSIASARLNGQRVGMIGRS